MRTLLLHTLLLFSFASFLPSHGGPKAGHPAPEIAAPGPNGDTIRLSSLRGKVVLVDFWASWCHPCRESNPDLVQLYHKYHDRDFKKNRGTGFEILSVSLDDDETAWKKAIADDHLEWPNHVCELLRWNSHVAKDYGVTFIPVSFLIDADGNIIATNLDIETLRFYLKRISKSN